jgi:hypothetical protein
MHPVQPPKDRHGMKEYVLKVNGEIEQDDTKGNGDPGRHGERIEQPQPLNFKNKGEADGRHRKQDAHQDGVQRNHGKVAGPSPDAANLLNPTRRKHLPCHHRRQKAGECGKAHKYFV